MDRQYEAVLETIALGDEFFNLTADVRKQKGRMLKLWYNMQPNKPFRFDKCICSTQNIIDIFETVKNFINTNDNETTTR